jgi:predicted DNA-binding transcriptional regulator AlpA
MSRKKKISRQPRKPQRRRSLVAASRDNSQQDYTVPQWCHWHRISRSTFYSLLKIGSAPKSIKIGKSRRIPHSADLEWQAQREAEAAAA